MNSPNQLSFLPDDYLERKAQRRTNAICASLFLVVAVAIGAAFVYTGRAMRLTEQEHARVEQEYADAARQIEQVKQLQEKQRKMSHQAELTGSLLEKVPRSYLLAEVTNALPGGVSLLDFNLDARKRAVVAPSPVGKTSFEIQKAEMEAKKAAGAGAGAGVAPQAYDVAVKITGAARTDVQVAAFMRKLSQSDLLRDVNLLFTDVLEVDKEKMRKFQIEAMVNPEAEPTTQPAKLLKTAAVEVGN